MINTNIELMNEIRNVKKHYDCDEILSSKTYQEYLKSQAKIALGKATEMRSVDFEIIVNKKSDVVAYTDGNRITNNVLCPMVRKAETLADKDRINQGKMFHEIGHRFFTDFRTWNSVFDTMKQKGEWFQGTEPKCHEAYEEVTRLLKENISYRGIMFSLYKNLTNIFEDEYIEKCMSNVIGGEFLESLRFTRRRVIAYQETVDKCIEKIKAGKIQFLSFFMNALLIHASSGELVGCENCQNEGLYQELMGAIERCKKYTNALSIETNTKKRILLCNYLLCEIHQYVNISSQQNESKDSKQTKSNMDEINHSLDSEIQQSSVIPKGMTPPIQLEDMQSSKVSSNQSESNKLEDLYKKLAEVNLEQRASSKLQDEAKQIFLKQVQKTGFVNWHYIMERDLEVNEYMMKAYDAYYQEVRPYALKTKRMLMKTLKDKKLEGLQKGHMLGRFDTASYVSQIYTQTGRAFSKNIAPSEKPDVVFGLVIDESGSMEGDKIEIAKKSAILFKDVLSSIDVPHMIIGHTGYRDKSYIFMYHDFNNYDNKDKYRLVNLGYRNRNRDGATIKYACEKLKQRPEKNKILIVVTDGEPSEVGFHKDKEEDEDVRLTVQEESKDVMIFGAVIDGDLEVMEYMYYDKILDLTDLEKLPMALCKLIKRNTY